MNGRMKIVAATLALITSLGGTATTAAAAVEKPGYSQEHIDLYESHGYAPHSYSRILGVKAVPTKNVWSYARPGVYINGTQLSVSGIRINDTLYVPFRVAAGALGASYSYDSRTKTATMTAQGLTVTATDGTYCTYANGRVLFSITPNVIMSDGRMYIPASQLAKSVGMTLTDNGSAARISGSYKAITPASQFYRDDEVLWLARIIHAEAQGEPLLGQIAVGNVVLNRVRSAYYPNTIYGVIFDRKYGVQFSPILNGSIYNTPSYNATLAAKICLDGFDISEGAFFFLEPRLSTSSWIPKSREYAFTIGHHDFYK